MASDIEDVVLLRSCCLLDCLTDVPEIDEWWGFRNLPSVQWTEELDKVSKCVVSFTNGGSKAELEALKKGTGFYSASHAKCMTNTLCSAKRSSQMPCLLPGMGH